MFTRNIEMLIS